VAGAAEPLADELGMQLQFQQLYRDYARYGVLTRPPSA